MVNILLVRRKLTKLHEYLSELKMLSQYSFEEYHRNYLIKRAAERLLQLITDTAVDINTHILVDEGYPPPPDSYQSFVGLTKLNIYPEDFAYKIAPATGERNILVHEYEHINDRIVYESIGEALDLFDQYIGFVEAFVRRREGEESV